MSTSVLFTGYAPVHFVCFRPLFERLVESPGVEVLLSGGLRSKTDDGVSYDLDALYQPFGVEPRHLRTVEEIRDLEVDMLFAANTKMIAPRRVDARVQIFHGISFRNKAVREDNANADFYFIAGPYMRRAFERTGILPASDPRALPVGFMKTDRLLNGELDRAETLRTHGFAGDRPVILYAPTGQKHNSLETMGEEVIRRIGDAGEFDLIIKPHDHPKKPIDWRARLRPLESDHTVVSPEQDVVRLLHAADLLITDASSVSSEYSLLDRPMIFLDVPKLLERAGRDADSMLDTETWGRRAGDVVEQPDAAVDAIRRALDEPDARGEIRRAMAEDLFYNPGAAVPAALDWLRSRSMLPDARLAS